jgi:hypothetical protein
MIRGCLLERGRHRKIEWLFGERETQVYFVVGRASWTANCFISGNSIARERPKK